MQITKNQLSQNGHYPTLSIRENDDFSDIPLIGEKPSLRQQARIDITKDVKPPEVAIRIGGEIFGTRGNFSLVIGKAKSRKTFLMALVMAACLGFAKKTTLFGDAHFIEGVLPAHKNRVVFVDTEQGEYHVLKVAQRVTRLTGKTNPENFEIYGLRKFSTQERNLIIDEIIEDTPDLGLIIIDGIRDVITSINDEEQATIMANNLLR